MMRLGVFNKNTTVTKTPEERFAHAQEQAVLAFQQVNNLRQMVTDTERKVEYLGWRVCAARAGGNEERATQIEKEQSNYETTLELTRVQLEQALELAELIRSSLAQMKACITKQEQKISDSPE